jgi:hypothetical protein
MATNRIVSKKELEDSGASSLREFLNRERGLTMKPPEGTKAGVYVPRDLYTSSGKATVDRQDAEAKVAANTAADQAIINRMAQRTRPYMKDEAGNNMKHGGAVKKMASGGSASSRADGIAQRGKTNCKMC